MVQAWGGSRDRGKEVRFHKGSFSSFNEFNHTIGTSHWIRAARVRHRIMRLMRTSKPSDKIRNFVTASRYLSKIRTRGIASAQKPQSSNGNCCRRECSIKGKIIDGRQIRHINHSEMCKKLRSPTNNPRPSPSSIQRKHENVMINGSYTYANKSSVIM